jgi:hypothetical protein
MRTKQKLIQTTISGLQELQVQNMCYGFGVRPFPPKDSEVDGARFRGTPEALEGEGLEKGTVQQIQGNSRT